MFAPQVDGEENVGALGGLLSAMMGNLYVEIAGALVVVAQVAVAFVEQIFIDGSFLVKPG